MGFQKGVVTNPKGRPVGVTSYKTQVQQSFLKVLERKTDDGTGKKVKYVDQFLQTFLDQALNVPNSPAAKMIADRLFEEGILDSIDSQLNRSKREDEDFLQYRIYKQAFDEQKRCIDSKKKLKLKCAGRRAGKTSSNQLDIGIQAVIPNSLILIVGLTFGTVIDMYWDELIKLLESVGLTVSKSSKTDGTIDLSNGSHITFRGNSNIDERNKMRGFKYHLIIIDEIQSQKELKYLIDSILTPTLMDYQGTLILSGSGPRVRGTHWQYLWENSPNAFKINWNLTHNPHIPNGEEALAKLFAEKNISPNSPLAKREYYGSMDAYDDDALVFRLTDQNYYTDQELQQWIKTQPKTDLIVYGGLDYGWTDYDAFVLILASRSSPNKYVIYEHKQNRQAMQELVNVIQTGVHQSKQYGELDYIYADHNEQRATFMLSDTYNLPMMNALKTNKDMAIEVLQDEVRAGTFKVKRAGVLSDECLHTVFKRDEADNLTRILDDDEYHADALMATIYALRSHWNWYPVNNKTIGDD